MPLISRNLSGSIDNKFSPLKLISPEATSTPLGNRPRIDSAVKVFPEPLSPTIPKASPSISEMFTSDVNDRPSELVLIERP